MTNEDFDWLCGQASDQLAQFPDGADIGYKYAVIAGCVQATAGQPDEQSFTASQLKIIFDLVYDDAKNDPMSGHSTGSGDK